jgi:hypothetical protein
MKATSTIEKASNSKGASIFKKMLANKKLIYEHLKTGRMFSDLKKRN